MKKRILLIEDHEHHSNIFVEVAEKIGASVEVAPTVDALRELVKKYPFGEWDLIVMDCQMPAMAGSQRTTQHIDEIHQLIWPLVKQSALWIWSYYDDALDVQSFLAKNNLLKYTIAKDQTPERLEISLKRVLDIS